MEILKARVKYSAGKEIETKYGLRKNIVVELANGQEIKIWGNRDIEQYQKGQEIMVVAEEQGKYQILPTPQPSMEEAITKNCELMANCYKQMEQLLPELDKAELQAMATSVFIHLARRLP